MKARLLRDAKAKELFEAVPDNLSLYRSGNFDFLTSDPASYFEIKLEIDHLKLASISCDGADHKEAQNCKIIFEAMGSITPYLARDTRLWIYLTHTFLLDYSRRRWPISDKDEEAVKHIRNHFFVLGNRGIERDNSAARLWWMARLCARVEELSLDDALTCLLYQYDVRAQIIERPTTSQSIHVFSTILKKLNDSYKYDEKKSLFEREKFREIMKELNLRGGLKLLGALDESKIQKIVDECI